MASPIRKMIIVRFNIFMAAANLGKTKNSGYEIELKHANHIGKDFNYTVGLTYSHAKNEILMMDEPDLKTDYRNNLHDRTEQR